MKCDGCGKQTENEADQSACIILCDECRTGSSKNKNPVRVLNDALHEYRTKHTNMSKEQFFESGCYDAFMWAWQNNSNEKASASPGLT